MLIEAINLEDILSFQARQLIALRKLNILIGTNGSGKSNFIDAILLMRSLPKDWQAFLRENGGTKEWFNKINPNNLTVGILSKIHANSNWHQFGFKENTYSENNIQIDNELKEKILNKSPITLDELSEKKAINYQARSNQTIILNNQEVKHADVGFKAGHSVLSQLRDPVKYPEITYLAENLPKIVAYREWQFGRKSPLRNTQRADMPNDFLLEDCSNLGLILNTIDLNKKAKQKFMNALQALYPNIDDYKIQIYANTVQIFLQEADHIIPATRLSDGTLRYLCLLAILCHPTPPPLVIIEEPELGLHPDVLSTLADLLRDTSERCQLIVTTHSDILVDVFSNEPEVILVFDKDEQGTKMKRLNAEELAPWLQEYRLGHLWTSGQIGGVRW